MEVLTVPDINLTTGIIYIKSTAKTNARTLPLKPNQILLFYEYIHEKRNNLLNGNGLNSLLIGIRGIAMKAEDITKHVKRSFKETYPGRKVNAQTIRQSIITNLLKQGHDLSIVQSFAGHKYPSATQRYRQQEVETLKAAVNKYHPLQWWIAKQSRTQKTIKAKWVNTIHRTGLAKARSHHTEPTASKPSAVLPPANAFFCRLPTLQCSTQAAKKPTLKAEAM